MRPHFSSLVTSLVFFHFLCSHVCLCYKVSSQLELNTALSSSLHTRFFSPCGLRHWAVINACQSGTEWPSARESARGQLLCIFDLWALQQEDFLCKCNEHGATWVHNKSEGCLTAPIFTRFIIGSTLSRGETKCCLGAERLRGLETQPDNELEGCWEGTRRPIQCVDS